MENPLTKIMESVKALDSSELRRISYTIYAEIAKCHMIDECFETIRERTNKVGYEYYGIL